MQSAARAKAGRWMYVDGTVAIATAADPGAKGRRGAATATAASRRSRKQRHHVGTGTERQTERQETEGYLPQQTGLGLFTAAERLGGAGSRDGSTRDSRLLGESGGKEKDVISIRGAGHLGAAGAPPHPSRRERVHMNQGQEWGWDIEDALMAQTG